MGDAHRRSDTFIEVGGSDGAWLVPPPIPPVSSPPRRSMAPSAADSAPSLSIRGVMKASGVDPPPRVAPPPGPPPGAPPSSGRNELSRESAVPASPAKEKVLTATSSKSAKRRATNAFLIDPTMVDTLQKVKDKADAAKVEEKIGMPGSAAELEEIELQMLRGIFAAHDENKDGIINKSQLAEALVSLGYSPTEKLMTKFFLENAKAGKKHWRISLETFLSAASKWLDSADDCSADVMHLFEMFDKEKNGMVSAQVVRHLLHEAVTPTRLTRQETEEFMKYSKVGMQGSKMRLKASVDYEDLVDKLMF